MRRLDENLESIARSEAPENTALLMLVPFLVSTLVIVWTSFALSRRLRRYARRRALLSADKARQIDPRPPVLFLRSFRDDQVSLATARMPWLLRILDPGSVAGTLEEMLTREYAYLGPLVTIGRPGEALPPLGAARAYCSGEEWRDVVESLMDAASLIVVGVDRTPGLGWEIARLRQHGLLERTIFILPPVLAADRRMLAELLELAGFEGRTPALEPSQAALALSFPLQNRALLTVATRMTEIEYQLAVRSPAIREQVLHGGEARPERIAA